MTDYEFFSLNALEQQKAILKFGQIVVDYLQGSTAVKVYQFFTFYLKVTSSATSEKIELLREIEKFKLYES